MTHEPTTELDERFSEQGADATGWQAVEQALAEAQLAWISTVRADGRPHVTPLVPVWVDAAVYFTTGPGEQKAINLASNPAVVITTGCNTWDRGLDVMVEGLARRVTDPSALERLAGAWRTRWDGGWEFVVDDGAFRHASGGEGQSHVFEVVPVKVLAFGKAPYTHTRHRFADTSVRG